jgi:hypothetical protein
VEFVRGTHGVDREPLRQDVLLAEASEPRADGGRIVVLRDAEKKRRIGLPIRLGIATL